jgi:tetratricopeptide (TPR) repeat protein
MKTLLTIIILTACQVIIAQKSGKDYFNLAEQKSVNGKMKKAYKYYYKAAELDKNYVYYVKAAEAYWLSNNMDKKKNKDKVELLYNKSMSLQSWNIEGLLSRANYWEYMANYTLALRNLDSLLIRDKSNKEGYLLKAKIYMMKKDTVNAFLVYDAALKNIVDVKDRASIYNNKGTQCYFKGYWLQCIESYQQSIKINGQFNFYWNCLLSSAYYYTGNKEKACYYFELCDVKKYPKAKNEAELIEKCK